MARAFYALQDTKTPVIVSVVALVVNIVLSVVLIRPFGLIGLALAYVVAGLINFSVLIFILGERLGSLQSAKIVSTTLKIMLAAIPAGLIMYGALQVLAPVVNMDTFMGVFIQGVGAGLAGVITYAFLAHALNLPEMLYAVNWLKLAWQKLRSQAG